MDQVKRKARNDAKFQKILSEILNSEQKIIRQNEQGFQILNLAQFKLQIIPKFFKHNKYESFLRQLNKYGYKITIREKNFVQFSHESNLDKRIEKQQHSPGQYEALQIETDLELTKMKLVKLQEEQYVFMKQMDISIKIMNCITNQFQKLIQTTTQTVNYCSEVSAVVIRNLQKAWPNSLGEIQQSQLRAGKLAFPEYFQEIQLQSPNYGYIGTPDPFYFYSINNSNHEQ